MNALHRLGAFALVSALSLALATASFAQQGRGRRPQGMLTTAVIARLNLNEEQKTKITTAGEAYIKAAQDANALTTPKEKRQANTKARTEYLAVVTAALNDEQKKQLEAFQAEAKELTAMMGQGGNQMVGLNLTAEQKTKIKEIADKYAPERQKLADELKAATEKKPVQDKIAELGRKQMEEIRPLLSDDQRKLLGGGGRKKQQ